MKLARRIALAAVFVYLYLVTLLEDGWLEPLWYLPMVLGLCAGAVLVGLKIGNKIRARRRK